jgi:hypothetical protein
MTAEPASTRANRINSDSLDWSYIGISFAIGHSTSAWRARGRSTADPPSPTNRWPQMASATPARTRLSARPAPAPANQCTPGCSFSLSSRTLMAKTKWSSNVLFVALIFPLAKPTTRTRSPCDFVETRSLLAHDQQQNQACFDPLARRTLIVYKIDRLKTLC